VTAEPLTGYSPIDLQAFNIALDELGYDAQRDRWRADPVAWAQERLGEHVWSKQGEVMRACADHPLVAVRSGHGVGKSHLASRLVGWFLDTRPASQTFVVTTAPTANQVRAILWRYIDQMHSLHGLLGRVTQAAEWKIGNELVAFGRKPSDYNESAFQGIHAKHLLVILDEACGIPEQLWIAADALATSVDSHILAIGNPDTTSSHFYKVCTTEAGWHRIRISSLDSPNMTGENVPEALQDTLVQPSWIEDKRLRWGEQNPLYIAKVLGEFADDEDGLIPLSWVMEANQRWLDWSESANYDQVQPAGRTVLGVDIGHQGEDKTVIATRKGNIVTEIEAWSHTTTPDVALLVEARLRRTVGGVAVVDSIGVGAGVLDLLRSRKANVRPFVAGAATKRREQTGTQGFPNVRSAAWWNLRELLDPSGRSVIALPPNDDLTADLTTPRWESRTGGKIHVESKDEIRKRLTRSTDYGDAVVQAFWADHFTVTQTDVGRKPLKPISYAASTGKWTSGSKPAPRHGVLGTPYRGRP
jgi:hypothetical protein